MSLINLTFVWKILLFVWKIFVLKILLFVWYFIPVSYFIKLLAWILVLLVWTILVFGSYYFCLKDSFICLLLLVYLSDVMFRFYYSVLLPRIRDDIREYKRLNFHLMLVSALCPLLFLLSPHCHQLLPEQTVLESSVKAFTNSRWPDLQSSLDSSSDDLTNALHKVFRKMVKLHPWAFMTLGCCPFWLPESLQESQLCWILVISFGYYGLWLIWN